jgi:hypothetical protein
MTPIEPSEAVSRRVRDRARRVLAAPRGRVDRWEAVFVGRIEPVMAVAAALALVVWSLGRAVL